MAAEKKEKQLIRQQHQECLTHDICFVCRLKIDDGVSVGYGGLNIVAHRGSCAKRVDEASLGYYQAQSSRTTTKKEVLRVLYRARIGETRGIEHD